MRKIVLITSLRDVALCDKNGQMVETGASLKYMEGALEHLVRATLPGGQLFSLAQVVGVITDDTEKDLGDYPIVPIKDRPWIHSLDLGNSDGMLIGDLTKNIPSNFRSLSLDDLKSRAVAKKEFELKVLEFMTEKGADVLLSDHYMARLDHVWAWMPRCVLNIHPGVTVPEHPYAFPGKTPTADAIERARNEEGVKTGATLHYVDGEIDHGPVIYFSEDTPVYGTDQPQYLRYRNYQIAKLPVLVDGLLKYLG